MLNDSGAGKTTVNYSDVLAQDYRKMNDTGRLVVGGQPCTYFYAIDQRKVPDKSIAEALTWAVPYNDQIVASGLIPGVNAIATQNLMPPGVPGREPYDPVEGHGPFQTDPAKAKQILTDSGNLGYEIKFLFATDSDTSVASKDTLVKGLEAAGFKATPVASTQAKFVADRDDVNGDINLRQLRLVLRLAVGFDLGADDLPVDGPERGRLRHQRVGVQQPRRSTRRSTTSSRSRPTSSPRPGTTWRRRS